MSSLKQLEVCLQNPATAPLPAQRVCFTTNNALKPLIHNENALKGLIRNENALEEFDSQFDAPLELSAMSLLASRLLASLLSLEPRSFF
jgi:hypothetical protein